MGLLPPRRSHGPVGTSAPPHPALWAPMDPRVPAFGKPDGVGPRSFFAAVRAGPPPALGLALGPFALRPLGAVGGGGRSPGGQLRTRGGGALGKRRAGRPGAGRLHPDALAFAGRAARRTLVSNLRQSAHLAPRSPGPRVCAA